jgi:hypothetical protein
MKIIIDNRELYQRWIDVTDRRVDALVYELYGLSDEEIRIVESVDKAETSPVA